MPGGGREALLWACRLLAVLADAPSHPQPRALLTTACPPRSKLRPPLNLEKKSRLLTVCLRSVLALPLLDVLEKHTCLFLEPPDVQVRPGPPPLRGLGGCVALPAAPPLRGLGRWAALPAAPPLGGLGRALVLAEPLLGARPVELPRDPGGGGQGPDGGWAAPFLGPLPLSTPWRAKR